MTHDPYPGHYQPYPGAARLPPRRGPLPSSVVNAVRLMYVGAAVSAVSAVIGLASIGSVKNSFRHQYPRLSAAQLNTDADAAIVGVVVVGLIGIGLWLWVAFMCRAGKNWARITGAVFFSIYTVATLVGLARPEETVSRVVSVGVWLIGLGAVVYLWRRDSAVYFTQGQWQA